VSNRHYNLEVLSGSVQIPTDQLIQVNESTGSNESRGTWGHPKVAIRFAQWCSDEFCKNLVKCNFKCNLQITVRENREVITVFAQLG
jgi:hypothetical protein